MIFGVSTGKSEVVMTETTGAGVHFVISAIRPIPFQVRSGEDLAQLLQTVTTIFRRGRKSTGFVVALLKCSSGRFGSCLEAVKAEAVIELAAFREGVQLVKVAPQSLKKSLGCASDQKWRDRAAELFNPDDATDRWSKGLAGAAAAAFTIAGLGSERAAGPNENRSTAMTRKTRKESHAETRRARRGLRDEG